MKKSIIFSMAAVLVFLLSLTVFNLALRAEFQSGAFKDPLRDYATLPFRDFDEVVVEPGTLTQVRIEAGPFRVRRHPLAADYVQLQQQGRRLLVRLVFPKEQHRYLGANETLVISCPQLRAVVASGRFTAAGATQLQKEPGSGRVLVQSFRQDSLRLRQEYGSRIELRGNRLGYLAADAGQQLGARPELLLNASNQVAAATLALGHQSLLQLHGLRIGHLRYQLADSVRLDLTGASLPSMLAVK